LRVQELELTADFLMKVQEEKEAAREERERLREERKAEQELAAERERLDKERNHFANALQALKANGDEAGIAELTKKLDELDQAIAQNDYRTANIKAGYVYVISNAGAFGPNMVKIGMTRRLEPMDRVRELGDASVPFPFDVHALFFCEDAVALEADLHQVFATKRVNHINQRREFYFANLTEVHAVLSEKVGNLLEFTEEPEATQYRQSKGYWPAPN
jgi:seryl-tRNA synthetase